MPYYHVLVAAEPEPSRLRGLLSDLAEAELLAKFVAPYRRGGDLVCGNEILPLGSLRRVHIAHTKQNEATERRQMNEKSLAEIAALNREPGGLVFLSPGRGYDPEDILEVSEDVTEKFIDGPPGHASRTGPVGLLLNNQWTVAVGTGLIVAGLVWWLGWR